MELYEEQKKIPETIFSPFLKSLHCHSRSEEKMFQAIVPMKDIFKEHSSIDLKKRYSDDEKYALCKSLLSHMKEEEEIVRNSLN